MKKLLLLFPFILCSCSKCLSISDVNKLVAAEFNRTHTHTIIVAIKTDQVETYYISDLYYHDEFSTNYYQKNYITLLDEQNTWKVQETLW